MKVLIREYRGFRRMSQQALGEAIGRDAWHISRLENGHRTVTLADAKKMAEVLGVSLDKLVVDDDCAPEAPSLLEQTKAPTPVEV